ncbi:MAG: hypothetical protein JO293_08665 [Candidatus Eremiobacteraeota bacterium]|nr:hypothetical protein [Candidatus Eremiobacteraeota bacterium]MBV8223417.1 hypothetical protein [Candidatus Eremiobacteraeota bacterium]
MSITLVREPDAVDERVREAYRDIKASLRVPVVSTLFQAYAVVPRFLDYTWRRLRPNVLAKPFVDHAREIGAQAERETATWSSSDHAAELRARNVGEGDIARARETAAMLVDLDPKMLVIAHAVRLAMSGVQIGGGGTRTHQFSGDDDRLARDYRGLSVATIEERDAPLRVRTVYEEIKAQSGAPFVSGEYRAMGAFADWLEVWWRDMKAALNTARFAAACRELEDAAIGAARKMPYALNLRDESLARVEVSADERARLARVNESFCQMLPGIVLGTALAHRALHASQPAS